VVAVSIHGVREGFLSKFSFRLSVWCRWVFLSCRERGSARRREFTFGSVSSDRA